MKKIESTRVYFYILSFCVFGLFLLCFGRISEAAFSDIGAAARPLGMGGAFTAVADDASATFWNPAGLVQLGHYELSSMYLDYPVPNVSSQFISAVVPLQWDSALGLSLLFTGEPGLYQEQTIAFSYGQDLYNFIPVLPVAIGLSIKRLSVSFMGVDPQDPLFKDHGTRVANTTGTMGLIYQINPSLKFAAVLDNLASSSLSLNPEEDAEDEGTNKIYPSFRLGGAYTYRYRPDTAEQNSTEQNKLIFSSEFVHERVTETVRLNQLRLGVETWLRLPGDSALAVRAGGNPSGKSTKNFSIGAGYRFAFGNTIGAQLDYAFSYYDPVYSIGNHHRFSLSIAF